MKSRIIANDLQLQFLGNIGLRQPRAWLRSMAKGLLIDRFRRRKLEAAYLHALAHWPTPTARIVLLS